MMATDPLSPMQRSTLAIIRFLTFGCIAVPWAHGADTNSDLDRRFKQTVRPFLASYCTTCHGGTAPAAQFDLRQYTTAAAVVQDYPRWNLVLEKLSAKQMPPKQMKQPTAETRQEVIEWIEGIRANEARRSEERRVGKECRTRWCSEHSINKKVTLFAQQST